MKQFGGLFQSADWKMEKHVPVIECADKVKASENVEALASLSLKNRRYNQADFATSWGYEVWLCSWSF
jgi:superoxide reductase